jgi:hypothetical protein
MLHPQELRGSKMRKIEKEEGFALAAKSRLALNPMKTLAAGGGFEPLISFHSM